MRYILVIKGRSKEQTSAIRGVIEKKMLKSFSENVADAVKEFFVNLLAKTKIAFTITFKKFGQFVIQTSEPLKNSFFHELENLMRSRFHEKTNVRFRTLPA